MATQIDGGRSSERDQLDLEKQLSRIRQMGANTDKAIAETQKVKIDVRLSPWLLLAQGLIAGAALLGAGAALAKLFLT